MKRKIALCLTLCFVFCSFAAFGINANADIYNDTFIAVNGVEYFAHSIIVKTYEPVDTSIYSIELPADFCGIKAVGVYGWDETYYEQYGYMKYIVELEESTTFSQAEDAIQFHPNVIWYFLRKAERTPDGTLINDKVLVPNSIDNTFVKDGIEYFLHELYVQSYELIEDSTIYTKETPNDFFGVQVVKVSAWEDYFEENGFADYFITTEDSVDIYEAVDVLTQNEKIKSVELTSPCYPDGGVLSDIPAGTEILDNEPENTEPDVNDTSSDIIEDSSDITEDSSNIVNESSDVIDESSDIVEDSSDVVEDSSDVVDESSDIIENEENIILGDINGNDKIDMTDYILLKRAYFGTYTLDDNQKYMGDINQNGKIDMTDYILLKRIYFGTWEINFPIKQPDEIPEYPSPSTQDEVMPD